MRVNQGEHHDDQDHQVGAKEQEELLRLQPVGWLDVGVSVGDQRQSYRLTKGALKESAKSPDDGGALELLGLQALDGLLRGDLDVELEGLPELELGGLAVGGGVLLHLHVRVLLVGRLEWERTLYPFRVAGSRK